MSQLLAQSVGLRAYVKAQTLRCKFNNYPCYITIVSIKNSPAC